MFLSQLELNLQSRRVQKELANRYELHRTLMHAFKKPSLASERLLFRLEADRGSAKILVQSQNMPDWSFFTEEEIFQRYLIRPNPDIKTFSPQIFSGQKLLFRLVANPSCRKAIYKDDNGHGKRIGLYTEEDQLKWLEKKGNQNGFIPIDVSIQSAGTIRGVKTQDNKKHILKIPCVRYDGLLQVSDPMAFENGLKMGIGPAKGFGCGLLSLAVIR